MNTRNALIVLCAVLACVCGVLLWKTQRPIEPESIAKPIPRVTPERIGPPPTPKPQPVQASTQTLPTPPVETPVAPEPKAEAPAQPPDPPAPANTLTRETLAGTKWEDGLVAMKFLPDGRWEMNGRICAKWAVEGNRVRIYDEKGEEHYVDIVGDTLEFNGQKIAKTKD